MWQAEADTELTLLAWIFSVLFSAILLCFSSVNFQPPNLKNIRQKFDLQIRSPTLARSYLGLGVRCLRGPIISSVLARTVLVLVYGSAIAAPPIDKGFSDHLVFIPGGSPFNLVTSVGLNNLYWVWRPQPL